jgi:hypothetical protein
MLSAAKGSGRYAILCSGVAAALPHAPMSDFIDHGEILRGRPMNTNARPEARRRVLPHQPGGDIYRERNDDRVEQEAQQPVQGGDPAQLPAGDLDVGHLERHPQHQREI